MNATEAAAAGAGLLRRLRRHLGDVVFFAVALVAAWLLWPSSLGGCTTLTVVSGHSMEPTYYTGDLVVGRCGQYEVGDIVTYNPPNVGRARIIHRIIGGDGATGWVIQGDNNDFLDPWQPTDDRILGKSVLRIPKIGLVGSILVSPFTWFSMFLIAGALVIWPKSEDADDAQSADSSGTEPDDPSAADDPSADDPFRMVTPHPAPSIEEVTGASPEHVDARADR